MKLTNTNLLLPKVENISENLFEHGLHNQINQEFIKNQTNLPAQTFFQSSSKDQVPINKIISKKNEDQFISSSHKFMGIPIENQMLSTSTQISSTIFQSRQTE